MWYINNTKYIYDPYYFSHFICYIYCNYLMLSSSINKRSSILCVRLCNQGPYQMKQVGVISIAPKRLNKYLVAINALFIFGLVKDLEEKQDTFFLITFETSIYMLHYYLWSGCFGTCSFNGCLSYMSSRLLHRRNI